MLKSSAAAHHFIQFPLQPPTQTIGLFQGAPFFYSLRLVIFFNEGEVTPVNNNIFSAKRRKCKLTFIHKMPASCVNLESDAYLVCLTHALSTEREEVMGLLIGEVKKKRKKSLVKGGSVKQQYISEITFFRVFFFKIYFYKIYFQASLRNSAVHCYSFLSKI